MFLNGISCYGVHFKACLMVFECPPFGWAKSINCWKIGLSITLICRIFTWWAASRNSKNWPDKSTCSSDFSVTERLSPIKCRSFKDQKTSFQTNPITWNSDQELRRYSHSNIGAYCELLLCRMQNWFRGCTTSTCLTNLEPKYFNSFKVVLRNHRSFKKCTSSLIK